MNVALATVAEDVGTTITGIQTAITLCTLVMAMLMVTREDLRATSPRRCSSSMRDMGCLPNPGSSQ